MLGPISRWTTRRSLWPIVVVRLRWHQPHPRLRHALHRQGKTSKEVIRCRKRYVAREVFAALRQTDGRISPPLLDPVGDPDADEHVVFVGRRTAGREFPRQIEAG